MSTLEYRPAVFGPPVEAGEVGVLGRFRIQKQIGHGGMGVVFQAIDTRLGRPVALKMMRPELVATERARQRFLLEARAAAKVVHDNVVNILDIDEIDGVPFISMPFLKGRSLEDFFRKKPRPSASQVLRIAREMALGLEAAHELGVVHRDIKPANIWLEAPKGRVKILDFGLAKLLHDDSDPPLTSMGKFIGTAFYVAPEQAQTGPIDHRADLYSLGSVLYHILTGKAPFERPGGLLTVLSALANEQPKPVREVNPGVPEGFAALIHQLLSKDPDRRPRSAGEVADSLRQLMLARVSGEMRIEAAADERSAGIDSTEKGETPLRTIRTKSRPKEKPVESEVGIEVVEDVEMLARRGFVVQNASVFVAMFLFLGIVHEFGRMGDLVVSKSNGMQFVLPAMSAALAIWIVIRRARKPNRTSTQRFFSSWLLGAVLAGLLGLLGGALNDVQRQSDYGDSGHLIGGVFGLVTGFFAGLLAAIVEWFVHRIRMQTAILDAEIDE